MKSMRPVVPTEYVFLATMSVTVTTTVPIGLTKPTAVSVEVSFWSLDEVMSDEGSGWQLKGYCKIHQNCERLIMMIVNEEQFGTHWWVIASNYLLTKCIEKAHIYSWTGSKMRQCFYCSVFTKHSQTGAREQNIRNARRCSEICLLLITSHLFLEMEPVLVLFVGRETKGNGKGLKNKGVAFKDFVSYNYSLLILYVVFTAKKTSFGFSGKYSTFTPSKSPPCTIFHPAPFIPSPPANGA